MKTSPLLVFGAPGSFAHAAAMSYFAPKKKHTGTQVDFVKNIFQIFHEVQSGSAQFGLVPLANSQSGFVRDTFDYLQKNNFELDPLYRFNPQNPMQTASQSALRDFQTHNPSIQTAFCYKIEQCLLTLPKIQPAEIKQIISHPQAIWQCNKFLNKKFAQAKHIEWADTATAAHDLGRGILHPNSAVIASAAAAKLYGLKILAKNIENHVNQRENLTTFLVLRHLKSTYQTSGVNKNIVQKTQNSLSESINSRFQNIDSLRQQIDQIDQEIIEKIAERFQITRKIGLLKKRDHAQIHDQFREKKLKSLHNQLAKQMKIKVDFISEIFDLILIEAKKIQKRLTEE